MSTPVTVVWELHSPASLRRTWEAFSDTDRFNKLAEMGFRFESHPQADGSVLRTGEARFLGLVMSWDELPFTYSAPDWFRVERRFHGGPAEKVIIQARLRANSEGGADVRYSIAVHPRGVLTRPLVQLELAQRTKPKVERALNFLIRELSGPLDSAVNAGVSGLLSGPPRLSDEEAQRLTERAAALTHEGLRGPLVKLIREAPLREQDRILPLARARAWGIPQAEALPAFLDAVRAGLLTLRWELICPACQGPAETAETLAAPGRRVHCASCNVHFDATFPDSVAVSLRTAPGLRDFSVPIECIGSPARQPHVLAQQLIGPGEQVDLALPMEVGPHRLRSWPPRDTATLEVTPSGAHGELRVSLDDEAFSPARAQLGAGHSKLVLSNVGRAPVRVVVERHTRDPDLLTASRLLSIPGARALLPEQAIDPSLRVEAQRAAVVLLRHGEAQAARAEASLKSHSPRRLVSGERGSLATWADAEAAAAAAAALAAEGWPVTLTVGPIVEVSIIDEVVPMGLAVDDALRWMALSTRGFVVAAAAQLSDPELAAALRRAGLQPAPGARPLLNASDEGCLLKVSA